MKSIYLVLLTFVCLSGYAQAPDSLQIDNDQRELVAPKTYRLTFPPRSRVDSLVQVIAKQAKDIDSLKNVVKVLQNTTPPTASQPSYGEVTTSTYTVTAADAGKHIVFRSACTITVTGLQPGHRVSLSSVRNRLPVSGSGMHSKSSFKTIQAGGCATVVGENGGFSLSGDLSN